MASYKLIPGRNGAGARARFHWRIGPDQFNRTLPVANAAAAERRAAAIEETLLDLQLGKRVVPPGADVVDFVISGGVVTAPLARPTSPRRASTLGELAAHYQASVTKDAATRYTEDIHLNHLLRLIGTDTPLPSLDLAVAQRYADRRLKEKAKNQAKPKGGKTGAPARQISPTTVTKELKTLRIVWNWVSKRPGALTLPGPLAFDQADVQMPPEHPKAPFRTWAEIEKTIKRGGLAADEVAELWECLYLDTGQVRELLEYIRANGARRFVYPMAYAAAFTGARRSELARSRIDDWDLEAGIAHVRQKKAKVKTLAFDFRNVDIASSLSAVIRDWLDEHPGGQFMFCADDGGELRPDTATYFLNQTLAGSKWAVVRGWHTFRHSFASNLARAGKDQRIIDSWMGHHTEIRLRYQHLFPDRRRDAIESLIG